MLLLPLLPLLLPLLLPVVRLLPQLLHLLLRRSTVWRHVFMLESADA